MNELKIFENEEFGQVKSITTDRWYLGFVYFVEYGKNVKIGATHNPFQRLSALKRELHYNGNQMGRVALSMPHSNYYQNESALHDYFKANAIEGTELFNLPFEDVVKKGISVMDYVFDEPKTDSLFIDSIIKDASKQSIKFTDLCTSLVSISPTLIYGKIDHENIREDLICIADSNSSFENTIFSIGLEIATQFIEQIRYEKEKQSDY